MKQKLLVVGAWGLLDHFLAVEQFPQDGETILLQPDTVSAEQVFFGDCSGNIAAVAAKLGTEVGFVSVVGYDFESSGYQAHLQALSVDLSGVTVIPDLPSGHNYNCFAPDGRGFCLSQQGAAARQSASMISENWFSDAAYTVICEAFSPYTLQAARFAKRQGSQLVLSGMVGDQNPLWKEFLSLADVLFINRSEYQRLLLLSGSEKALFDDFSLSQIFLTCGAEGSMILTPDEKIQVPVIPAEKVLDPTGAGDAFVAGTLTGLLRGLSAEQAARIGAAASSFIIEAVGCQTKLPSWEQVNTRLDFIKRS